MLLDVIHLQKAMATSYLLLPQRSDTRAGHEPSFLSGKEK
jgi:hypothetical protein